jgi:GNAT superfamily N-acetyltransferase
MNIRLAPRGVERADFIAAKTVNMNWELPIMAQNADNGASIGLPAFVVSAYVSNSALQATKIKLVPLNWFNMLTAWLVAKRIFSKCSLSILQTYATSLLPRWPWPARIRKALAKHSYYIVSDGSAAIGITGLYTITDQSDEAWIGWYGLDSNKRGSGTGSSVLRATIDLARRDGHRMLRLWTTTGSLTAKANELYRSFGFSPEPTQYKFIGLPILIYSLSLQGGAVRPFVGSFKNAFADSIHSIEPRPLA